MKKYLMTGIAALTLCAGFTSCSHDDFEPMTQAEIDKAKYDMAFLNYVGGKIAANQDWGFGSTRALTRGTFMNANQYCDYWDTPNNVYPELTDEDLAAIKALLSPGEPTYNTLICPYENYWVQQVYKGEATYTPTDVNGNSVSGTTITGSNQMDKLVAYNENYTAWDGSHYEHVNNFNNGNNTNEPGTCSCGIKHVGTTLMTGMSTEGITPNNQFGFHESYGTSHNYCNYLIVEYNGYWYVGFDYEMHKNEAQNANEAKNVERDWKFTDWIVRITPAYAKGTTPETPATPVVPGEEEDDNNTNTGEGEQYDLRIIAEDLSAQEAGDFDFNDVVFDVKFDDANAKIKILAAGGTLPLYIETYEVHEALGAEIYQMVNTNAKTNGVTVEEKDLPELPLGYGVTSAADAKKIKVWVEKNGVKQELTAEKGEPAAKLAVGIDFQWLDERQSIKDEYELFIDWATQDGFTSKWW